MTDFAGPNKRKRKSPSAAAAAARDTRVTIGASIDRWRKTKAAKGYRSDAEMAQDLLDAMNPTAAAASKKMKCSQLEVQTLIEQEVHTAVQARETHLQGLMETIQQLDCSEDYESSIQELEARVNRVTRRAEAAIAFMAKKQTKEDTKKALNKMQVDNEALKGAAADPSEERPPPVLTPYGSPKVKENVSAVTETRMKHETRRSVATKQQQQEKEEDEEEEEEEATIKREEPTAGLVKVERLALRQSCSPECKVAEKDSEKGYKLLYPPLPSNSFPSSLDINAASYNIPHRLQVRLALIRNPAGLSVLWNVEEEDLFGPPMGSYSVLMTVEKVKDSNEFPEWTRAEVEAKPLPMCMMISKYKPGRKVCVAVVGRDAFGRYGPYSKVVTAFLPDE